MSTGIVSKGQIDEIDKSGGKREDFERNLQLGFKTTWERHQDYKIQDDNLIGIGPSRTYAPMVRKELPSEIAKLTTGDEKSVIKFAKDYEGFGHSQLSMPSNGYSTSESILDPLDWIWAHSRNIKFCLELPEYLKSKDENKLYDFLNIHLGQKQTNWYWSETAYRDKVITKRWKLSSCGNSLIDLARYIRMEIINKNIVGIRREFQDVDGLDQDYFAFSALIEVAYWQIADTIKENQEIIRCEECGASFVKTHTRQKFCPPKFRQTESACATRFRVRKCREKKKNKSAQRG